MNFFFKALRFINPFLVLLSVIIILLSGFQFTNERFDQGTDTLKQLSLEISDEFPFSKVNSKYSSHTYLIPKNFHPQNLVLTSFFDLIQTKYVNATFENFYYTFTSIHAP